MCRVPNTQRFAANTAASTYSPPSLKRPFFADDATSPSESGSPTVLDWQQEEALLLAGLGKVEPMIAAQPNSFYEWIADAPATENGMLADYPESLFESSSDSLLSLCQDDNTRSPFILPTHTSDRTSLPDFSWTLTPSANLLMTTPNGNLLMPPIALDTTSSQLQQQQQQQQPQEVQQMMITPPSMTFAPVPTKKSTKSNKRVKTEHHPQPTKADLFEPASPADSLCDITDDMSPEEVKLIKRERNRLAAERYRRKGRNLVEKLQIRVDELTDENSSLRSEMAQMAEELRLVREMVKGSSISSLTTQRKIFV